jgi:membrane protein
MLALIPVLCCIVVFAKMAHVDHYAQERLNVQIDGWITSIEKGQDSELAKLTTPQDEESARKKKIAAEEFARQARSFSDQLFGRIAKFDVRKMGWIGFALLLWTVISSLGQVEVCLNEIWDIEKPRPIWKKVYLYIFVATVMPIFAILAMSMPILNVVKDVIVATMGSTWLTKWASDGLIWFIEFWAFKLLISIGFASLAFGYFFWVLPNCKVRWRHAWYGGVLTAVLFGAVMKLCAIAQVGIAKSNAMYGSFAFIPIILAWLYMSCQIILLGSNMTYAFECIHSGRRPGADG